MYNEFTYQVCTTFRGYDGSFTTKNETTTERNQALGAASIYMLEPSCASCFVYMWYPGADEPRSILRYNDR